VHYNPLVFRPARRREMGVSWCQLVVQCLESTPSDLSIQIIRSQTATAAGFATSTTVASLDRLVRSMDAPFCFNDRLDASRILTMSIPDSALVIGTAPVRMQSRK